MALGDRAPEGERAWSGVVAPGREHAWSLQGEEGRAPAGTLWSGLC